MFSQQWGMAHLNGVRESGLGRWPHRSLRSKAGPVYASRRSAPLVEERLLPINRWSGRKVRVSGQEVGPMAGMVPLTRG